MKRGKPVIYRTLGKQGLKVSCLGLGGVPMNHMTTKKIISLIRECHDYGINLIDIYMMEYKEHLDPKKYPVYRDFSLSFDVSSQLIQTLNDSLKATYQIENGGCVFDEAFAQLELFIRVFKYDRFGIKQRVFDALDPLVKGSSSFSYHRDSDSALKYLNLEHDVWYHPMDRDISSHDSFLDLYNKALDDGASIVDELEKICQSGIINKDDIYSIIPNISSVHGLECGKKLKIKNKKIW